MEDKRMNEIEEIEATEVDETQDSSNAGALLAGVIGGFIAYAVIGGAKKLRVIIEEKVAAKKLAEAAKTDKAEIDSADEDSEENCGVLQGRVPITGRFPFFLFIKFWRCTNA